MAWSPPVDDPSLTAFRNQVRSESIERRGRAIPSGTAEQASIIIEIFFAIAQSDVRVLTGDLDARVYGKDGVIVEAKKFLANRERSLSIIFLKAQERLSNSIRCSHLYVHIRMCIFLMRHRTSLRPLNFIALL
jgi:hypothetical protein